MRTFGSHADSPPKGMLTGFKLEHMMLLNDRTNDGRLFEDTGFDSRELPVGFSAMFTTNHGPGQAHLVGHVDYVVVNDDNSVDGFGWLMDSPIARTAGRLIQAKVLRGNSAELSVRKVKMRWDNEAERILFDFTDYELSASTAVANPAMRDCYVVLDEPDFDFGEAAALDAETVDLSEVDAPHDRILVGANGALADGSVAVLTAGAVAPEVERVLTGIEPPAQWFTEDALNEGIHYPIRVTTPNADGLMRVHGYVAAWGVPHLSVPGMSILPPKSLSDYAYFANGEVLADDGSFLATGRLTYGGKHADESLNWREATAHYDNTLSAWADVAVGENEHGIWVAGYVRPGVDAKVLAMARASALSGDWRRVGGRLEMVGVLSVNAPAFPNPRPTALSEGGVQTVLIGAGLIAPDWQSLNDGATLDAQTRDDLRVLADDVRRQQAEALDAELRADLVADAERLEALLDADDLEEALA